MEPTKKKTKIGQLWDLLQEKIGLYKYAGLITIRFQTKAPDQVINHWSVHIFPSLSHWCWGYSEDWYDGPHYIIGLGPLLLIGWFPWGENLAKK